MSGKLIHNLKRKRAENARLRHQRDAANSNDGAVAIGLTQRSAGDTNAARKTSEPAKKIKLEHHITERDVPADGRTTPKFDFLHEALRKVNALQAELAALDNPNDDDDDEEGYDSAGSEHQEDDEAALQAFEAEALGFAVCARETMWFLGAHGLTPDNPLVVQLRKQLVGKCGQIPI